MNERNNLVSASSDSLAGIYWLDYDKIMESYMSSNSFVEQDILGKTVYVGFYRIKQPGWFMVTVLPSQPLINQSNILVLQFLSIYIAVLALAFCSQVPCPNPLQGEFPQLSVRCEQSVTVLRSLWTAQVRTMKLVILLILTTI